MVSAGTGEYTAEKLQKRPKQLLRRAKSKLPLSFVRRFLNKVRNRSRGSKPVDKAFSDIS
ncbi:hypothetical protein [Rhizobium phaseoli]|uniref:hypothetical protein n=1 Tax=Rhizobium phaseoli TaxID=396 RepID=UPI000A1C0887|nr:hypothetical protein [Rhizobium phaseoli]ARM13256.1 hypothetical protein Bra5_CH03054 [Rhizobium phaseoli Brasil 5]